MVRHGTPIWGFPKIGTSMFESPYNEDHSIFGFMLGGPVFRETPIRSRYIYIYISLPGAAKLPLSWATV